MTGLDAFAILVLAGAIGVTGLRWLRVAQREHYLPGMVTRFAARWWGLGPNLLLGSAVVIALMGSLASPVPALVVAAAVAVGPFGLSVKGRTSNLAWTRRLRTLAAVWLGLELVMLAIGLALGNGPAALASGAVAAPALVDLALALTQPLERKLGSKFVEQATAKLRSIRPTVVAITGSFGKTSTKGYVAHLVAGARTVSATPKSFNNRNGLARAINDHLPVGTDVFVAEMGTYGPGEIADMCRWVPPDIAVITAIGPVHLERMGSEDRIAEAKSEILDQAATVVLNVDYPQLARLARSSKVAGKNVVRVSSSDDNADVVARPGPDGLTVTHHGDVIARGVQTGAPAGNVACAVAVALALDIPADAIAARLPDLPGADNRLARSTGAGGFTILDDTYNSNPAGARRALDALGREAKDGGRVVLVTPGMVELGSRQSDENEQLARIAATLVTDLVVVGHTNRKALLTGAAGTQAKAHTVETRDDAVAWVKANLAPGDVVLYENDLPDHFA